MSKQPTLYLIRHGETPSNKGTVRVRPGRPVTNEPHLTRDARANLRDVGDALAGLGIQRVIVDDLSRTLESAQIVADRIGARRQVDKRLRAWNMGDLTGRPEKDVQDTVDRLLANPDTLPPGDGESFATFKARTFAALRDANKRVQSSGESEALVLHQRDFEALGIDPDNVQPGAVYSVTHNTYHAVLGT